MSQEDISFQTADNVTTFADYFVTQLPLSCLVYDNRGFGDSDTKEGHAGSEVIPATQTSNVSDAIPIPGRRQCGQDRYLGKFLQWRARLASVTAPH